jgi:hypothetical protein
LTGPFECPGSRLWTCRHDAVFVIVVFLDGCFAFDAWREFLEEGRRETGGGGRGGSGRWFLMETTRERVEGIVLMQRQ